MPQYAAPPPEAPAVVVAVFVFDPDEGFDDPPLAPPVLQAAHATPRSRTTASETIRLSVGLVAPSGRRRVAVMPHTFRWLPGGTADRVERITCRTARRSGRCRRDVRVLGAGGTSAPLRHDTHPDGTRDLVPEPFDGSGGRGLTALGRVGRGGSSCPGAQC
jgi:hypothetical protein